MTSRKSNGKTTPRTSRSQRRARTASKANKTIELEAQDITERGEVVENPEASTVEAQNSDVTIPSSEEAPLKPDAETADIPEKGDVAEAAPAESSDSSDKTSDVAEPVSEEADKAALSDDETKDTKEPEAEIEAKPTSPAADVSDSSDGPKAKSPVPPVAAAASVPAKSGGFGSGLLGGLLGGVAVVAVSYLGVQQGFISLPSDSEAQIEQVEQLSSVQNALAALESKVTAVETASSQGSGDDLSPLETRIGDVESKISSINTDLAALTEKAAAANNAANSVISKLAETGEQSGEQSADIASSVAAAATLALQGELEGINGTLEGYGQRLDDLESLKERLTALRGALDGLEAQVSEQASAVDAKLKEAESQLLAGAERRVNVLVADLANLDGKVTDMNAQIAGAAEALSGRVTALEENNLSAKMQSSAYTIALAGLENAVASGASFQLAFDTFSNVGSDNEALANLQPYAENGVPTVKQLAASFEPVYENVLREAKAAGEATLLDKFLLNAQNLVKVRSLDGEQKGESLTSKLGAVDYHLRQGDLAKALSSWDALPPAAKDAKAGAVWLAGLRGRIAVDAAMDSLRASGANAADGKES